MMPTTIKFEIDQNIIATWPDIQVAALRVNLPQQNSLGTAYEDLKDRLAEATKDLASFDPITTMPEISCWRSAYQGLGIKPSKFLSSIEALLRRTKKGDDLSIGIPAVDLYNSVSVLHRAPLGAYDAKKMGNGPIVLRRARPEMDHFTPLGGNADSFPLNPDLVVHAQGELVMCWGFNTRDSAKTGVDENSQDILFFSESTTTDGAVRSDAALGALGELIAANGGSVGSVQKANVTNSVGELKVV